MKTPWQAHCCLLLARRRLCSVHGSGSTYGQRHFIANATQSLKHRQWNPPLIPLLHLLSLRMLRLGNWFFKLYSRESRPVVRWMFSFRWKRSHLSSWSDRSSCLVEFSVTSTFINISPSEWCTLADVQVSYRSNSSCLNIGVFILGYGTFWTHTMSSRVPHLGTWMRRLIEYFDLLSSVQRSYGCHAYTFLT
ncbi:uncharacterized protein BO80DRAFT_289790 [Aspergillus ibericus CBS 121593]|uniref:Uncharacterized protein n=1 Tax=Aspergillus ibericus CBS 121593 TaxID=1448316 RepID=A0A395H7W6_9EURO|nr:hypothetical protein BO80DRAFT_289790 [Aspergillus ibericus CBS 121593]RAL03659.1 hypothetical protein BO80DRAFT_289790 [Aspergillus ibericus CBS 121593]